jgi:hypothetical protein
MSSKIHGGGIGDFFKNMIDKGKTLVNVYKALPNFIKTPLGLRRL